MSPGGLSWKRASSETFERRRSAPASCGRPGGADAGAPESVVTRQSLRGFVIVRADRKPGVAAGARLRSPGSSGPRAARPSGATGAALASRPAAATGPALSARAPGTAGPARAAGPIRPVRSAQDDRPGRPLQADRARVDQAQVRRLGLHLLQLLGELLREPGDVAHPVLDGARHG